MARSARLPLRASALPAALAAVALSAACQQLAPPPAELLSVLDAAPPAAERRIADCRIDAEAFAGDFRAIVVQSGERPVRIRLQLLPDFGGKLLDLIASADGVDADWPFADGGNQAPPAALGRAIGISLLEAATPIGADRVTGARRLDDGWLLALRPVLDDANVEVRAHVGPDGALRAREYRHGRLRWREERGELVRFTAPDFAWTLESVRREALDEAPASLFAR